MNTKTTFIFLTIALLGSSMYSKGQDWTSDQLMGKVRSLKETHRKMDASMLFNKNSTIYHCFKKVYNTQGKLLERTDYFSNGKMSARMTYAYDHTGKLIEVKSYDTTDLNPIVVNHFEPMNNRSGTEVLHPDDSTSDYYTYQYDEQGNLLAYKMYHAQGELMYMTLKKYDDKNHVLEMAQYGFDESLVFKITYAYDAQGNLITQTEYDADETFITQKFCTYNDKGLVIEEGVYEEDGSLYRKSNFEYVFDAQSNWVKATNLIDGSPNFTMEREIEYFK
jgi:hypothetical protein